MSPEKLSDIKKELRSLTTEQLIETCLRLAKYKKENKELLSYYLYHTDNPLQYAEAVKTGIEHEFKILKKSNYHNTKTLRKILRLLAKHAKYTGSAQVELEFSLWFCKNYLLYADLNTYYKPIQSILTKQFEKTKKLFEKLHEDLQFDYTDEYHHLLNEAQAKARWFNKKGFEL